MKAEQLLTCALDIGEMMLISGAEIGRYLLTASELTLCIHEPNTEKPFEYIWKCAPEQA